MQKYERIRFNGNTVILKISGESNEFLSGIQVNKYGDEVRSKGYDEHLHLIDKTTITRRTSMKMNNHYAELEEAKDEKCIHVNGQNA
jgi:hypothetical protein